MIAGSIIGWARYTGSASRIESIHGVLSFNDGGSLATACDGRWAITEPCEIWPVDAAPREPRCGLCEARWLDQRFVERGLRELIENTYSHVGLQARRFEHELGRFNPADRDGFEWWLGPCAHGRSPITRCAACAPISQQQPTGGTGT